MPVPLYNQVRPGILVSIVLKQDQRTGRQVQGTVSQVLTRGNHPHGVKVKLTDGRVGRVQQLVNGGQANTALPIPNFIQRPKRTMADHNPWASDDARSTSYNNPNGYYQAPQQQSYQSPNAPQQRFYADQPQSQQETQPPHQDHSSNQASNTQPSYQSYSAPYNPPPGNPYEQTYNQQPTYNAWEESTGNPPLPARHPAHSAAPAQHINRSDTDDLLASQEDRAEQVEHLQAYEATANQSVDDRNRAQLEKEFPDVDGSLIAALYGDTKDLSETREMLQELGRQ